MQISDYVVLKLQINLHIPIVYPRAGWGPGKRENLLPADARFWSGFLQRQRVTHKNLSILEAESHQNLESYVTRS